MTGAVFNRPLPTDAIGNGLGQLGAGAEDLATTLAKAQAAKDAQSIAVTTAPDGSVQVAHPDNSVILGRAGAEYNGVLADQTKLAVLNQSTQALQNIQIAHQDNPAEAKTAFDQYVGNLKTTVTNMFGAETGNAVADRATADATRRWANLAETDAERQTRVTLSGLQTHIADTQNQMRALARQGGIKSADYDRLQDQLQDGYDALTGNKLYGYAPERADSEFQTSLSMDKGEAIVGNVESIFKRTGGDGGRAGAQQYLKQLDDPDLHLSEQERDQFKRMGLAHLEYLTSDKTAAIKANRVNVDKMVDTLKGANGWQVDPGVINQAITQAKSLGDAGGAAEISAYADYARGRGRSNANLPDDQRLAIQVGSGGASEKTALDYFTSQGWTKEQASGIVGNLVRESRLNAGATNRGDGADGSDSIGIGQWNGTRAVALKQFAAAQGRSPNDFQTQLAFVQHELTTSEGNAAGMLRAAKTPQEAAAAFALGYERPQGFMTGDISKVAGGSDRVANAVRLAGGGASSAALIPSGPGVPTPAQMQANPYVMTAYLDSLGVDRKSEVSTARNVGEALVTAFSQGQLPQAETVANFRQQAAKYPDELGELAQKVQNTQAGASWGRAALQGSAADMQTFEQQVSALQHSGGASLQVLKAADVAQKVIQAGAENMKKDPIGEGAARGWYRPPAPIDFSQPQTVPAAIAQHGQAAVLLSAHNQAPQSAFSPADLPALKGVMTSGTLDQRSNLLAAITDANMPEPILKATLGQLAESKETLPLAVAGDLMRKNPDAARVVLQGQALMQADPKLAPNKDDFPTELAKAIPFNDMPQTKVREGIDGAVQAYYAKLSADANDTTGVLNDGRMKAAVEAVTGGVRAYRGSNFIAPWYGASQYDTDSAIRSLNDADFKGAQTSDGKPFSADALKPSWSNSLTWNNWRLQSQGDGKYLVFSGNDTNRQYLGNTTGGKFVLDLGSKRSAVQAAASGSSSPTPFADLPFTSLPIAGPM